MVGKTRPSRFSPDWREITLAVLLAAPLAVLLVAFEPIAQDPSYHVLADARSLFGIPNFGNVASNAAFLLVGVLGLHLCLTQASGGVRVSWLVLFLGITAVAAGSAYYHWNPGDATLTWDRLPMTVVVVALLSAFVAERVHPTLERIVLPVSLACGFASVAWWRYADDLRLYGWVQFAPLLAIVFLLTAYPAPRTDRVALAWAFGFYGLAKVAEHFDAAVYELTSRAISGHTLKHLLAALALFALYRMLVVRRRPGV